MVCGCKSKFYVELFDVSRTNRPQIGHELFMEYVSLPKKRYYNIENRTRQTVDTNAEQKQQNIQMMEEHSGNTRMALFHSNVYQRKWVFRYSLAEDEQFMQRTLLHLFRNEDEWNEFMQTQPNQLKYKTALMTRFIEENQSLSMMQCLMQFFDERYLNVVRCIAMLLNGDTDTNGLNDKINDLIEKSPSHYGVKHKYNDA
eukprot:1060699_1